MAKSYRISDEALNKRLHKMLHLRAQYLNGGIDDLHVRVMKGNDKTGKTCWTVSLIPIADCKNCAACKNNCYDIRNDCIYTEVLESRAQNSAIHKADRERYWREVGDEIDAKGITQLRNNVGGDVEYEDFALITEAMEARPECEFLFFTKSYEDMNQYISENIDKYPDNFGFPSNVHPLFSRWLGVPCDNPYHVPESHVLWENGETTAPEFGAYYCKGDCSNCFKFDEGCPRLKAGESVIFKAH